MAARPLQDVLGDLATARDTGAIPQAIYDSRARWVRANEVDGLVEFPEGWLEYSGPEIQASTDSVARGEPGEAVVLALKAIGWTAIVVGLAGGVLQLAFASEDAGPYGTDAFTQLELFVALQTAITGVVSGVLLMALAAVVDLLRRISARLAAGA